MGDRSLFAAGAVAAALAALCCVVPFLEAVLGTLGLTVWLLKATYVVIPALMVCLALLAFGLYRRRPHRG
jgi:mercuric ion transport protein